MSPPRLAAKLLSTHNGVAAPEFALAAVAFLSLTFGTIEIGRLIWMCEALEMTANQAARCMGMRAPSCAANGAYSGSKSISYIQSLSTAWGITLTDGQMQLSDVGSTSACAGLSEVLISYTFQTAMPVQLTMLLNGHACFPHQS